MKIKTITCHDVYNVGASLQAFALATYLKGLGHDTEIIDYKPDYLSGHYRLWGGVNSVYDKPFLREAYCLAKLPKRLTSRLGKRKKEFDSFRREHLPLTGKRYTSNEELKKDIPEADVYIAGSDQIWNTLFKNGRDPAFYLDFAPEDKIKASYAASFATEHIAEQYADSVKKQLSRFDYISVRESSGISILEELGIKGGAQVLDPVFLLDKEHWAQLADGWENREGQPYLLVYDFDESPEMIDFAKAVAREKNLKVISVLKNKYIKKNYSNEGPIAFLSLIKNAHAVVSNSFHATAFSLIFEKEFWVFNRNEHINTRMRDLAKMFDLDDRFNPESGQGRIDYKRVKEKSEKSINESKAFISDVLYRG